MTGLLDIVLLATFGAGAHFLLYRALITRWLWSRYPRALEAFFACSACTGFWVGLGVGVFWRLRGTAALGLEATDPVMPAGAAVVTMVLAPVMSWFQVASLERLGGGEEHPIQLVPLPDPPPAPPAPPPVPTDEKE